MRLYHDQPSGTVDRARDLRRNASDAEKRLLRALREAFPVLKWRHSVPFGPYYVDILCFAEKLVIEVDGSQHAEQRRYDDRRTRYMNAEGYRVLRFWNNDVLANTDGVIEMIANSLSLREREGAAKRRKGEDDERTVPCSPSPSHAATRRGPLPLPMGEER